MSDVAPTVAANCDKLDLGRFYTDLPKYFPYLSEKARNDWDNFKEANPEELSTRRISWDLQSLLSAAIISASQGHSDPENSISPDTLRLLQKEVATPKPVSAKNAIVLFSFQPCFL